jgi:hypothetical protein
MNICKFRKQRKIICYCIIIHTTFTAFPVKVYIA